MSKRYKVKKVDFSGLGYTAAHFVIDTQAVINNTAAVFSESKHGADARKLAMAERDRLNKEAGS